MEREAIRTKVEPLVGDLSGEKGEIRPDMELVILIETVRGEGGEETFYGIKGGFATRDGDGEMNTDPQTEFQLGLEGMDEEHVSEVAAALTTLVKIGATPQEVTSLVRGVEARRVRELYRDNRGL